MAEAAALRSRMEEVGNAEDVAEGRLSPRAVAIAERFGALVLRGAVAVTDAVEFGTLKE